MTRTSALALVLLVLLTAASCAASTDDLELTETADSPVLSEPTEAIPLEYSESYGMCLGYCTTTLTVRGDQIEMVAVSRYDEPDRRASATLNTDTAADLASLMAALDTNALEPSYGCPDCADGGATILTVGVGQHVWETGNPPAVVARLDQILSSSLYALRLCESTPQLDVSPTCQPID